MRNVFLGWVNENVKIFIVGVVFVVNIIWDGLNFICFFIIIFINFVSIWFLVFEFRIMKNSKLSKIIVFIYRSRWYGRNFIVVKRYIV